MTEPTLEQRSALFASEIQVTLDRSLPGSRVVASYKAPSGDKFVVRLQDEKMPLTVAGKTVAFLGCSMDQELDRSGAYLKTCGSKITVWSKIDRTPLIRLEYDARMRGAPISHWQIHAERGAMSHLLGRAHAVDPSKVSRPHDFSSLHFPIGGERFRPCLEDMIQFLIDDCGVDSLSGWKDAVESGREKWRRIQLRSVVRDSPEDAASVLRNLGYAVEGPNEVVADRLEPLRKW
ncbi:hypothetical protein OOZ51_20770 [Arthrobacter sp. MI7-26]|uniref:hypothetical protein n=1 Tax=Arthrobacter sp. MI7-26 TaxID=2993653 RepID=UPI002249012C|nr:hypothetical protein [Arthrobacter sp. MI7-26]MCX2750218.1 hypothetical protein [Arthrobacter sp. MI7-26]